MLMSMPPVLVVSREKAGSSIVCEVGGGREDWAFLDLLFGGFMKFGGVEVLAIRDGVGAWRGWGLLLLELHVFFLHRSTLVECHPSNFLTRFLPFESLIDAISLSIRAYHNKKPTNQRTMR